MKIGELAKVAKCTTETVRFYEKIGLLLAADRTDNNYRTYGAKHLERLRFIRNCRVLDMSHEEIRVLLRLMDSPADDCEAVDNLLEEHLGHVNARIKELTDLREQLTTVRAQCQTNNLAKDCGILQELIEMEIEEKPGKSSHLS